MPYLPNRLALVAAVIFAVGSIGAALTPDVWVMIFFRVVLGLAVGLSSVVVMPLYISESSPRWLVKNGKLAKVRSVLICSHVESEAEMEIEVHDHPADRSRQ